MFLKRIVLIISLILSFISQSRALQIFPLQIDDEGNVTFSIELKETQKVALAGSFNDWNKDIALMKKDEMGIYSMTILLKEGEYEYKIVLDDVQWIPKENIKFKIIKEGNSYKLAGEEGIFRSQEKRNNIKLNDKVYLSGLYKMVLITRAYQKNKTLKTVTDAHRHILDIDMEIYANDNVSGQVTIGIDTEKADYLNFWRGHVSLNTTDSSLVLYNNRLIIGFNDPLRSFDRWFYESKYPVFKFPILLYDSNAEKNRSGLDTRGLIFNYHTFIDFSAFVSRFNYRNDTLIGVSFKKHLDNSFLGFNSIIRRFKYSGSEYISPESSGWVQSPYNDDHYYQIDNEKYFSVNEEAVTAKNGIEFKISVSKRFRLFGEYLYKSKTGGYYAESFLSSGADLPHDWPHYSSSGYNYPKRVFFYELPYTGSEMVVGIQLTGKKEFEHQFSYSIDQINYKYIDAFQDQERIPRQNSLHSINRIFFKLNTIGIKNANEMKLIFSDNRTQGYDYRMLFDRDNFYNYSINEAYRMFHVKNRLILSLFPGLAVYYDLQYNFYFQRDIYFETGKTWSSETIENYPRLLYDLSIHWELSCGSRIKNYYFGQFIEKELFKRFSKMYFDPFVRIKYKLYKNFYMALEYGLDPEPDEDHRDGLFYYLHDNLDNNFPFFKSAEDRVMEQSFISIKGELSF
ncbi:MAG: hypothetical protein KKH98_15420 [Spirochaetes bacterium]|nr:hypothetical protein [Spirochaetota bacterium]